MTSQGAEKTGALQRAGKPWYAAGIHFQCQACGRCCRGEPGVVWVTRQEQERLAESLGTSLREFARKFVRRIGLRVSLREHANGDCALYDRGCMTYAVRPMQCRTFPFWHVLLRSPLGFYEATRNCRGVGKGRLYSREEIERISEGRFETGESTHGAQASTRSSNP